MDESLFKVVNRFAERTGWLHPPAVAYAKYGIVLFGVALLAGWWIGRQRSNTAIAAAVACTVVAVFVALGAAQVLGHLVDRSRPYDAIDGVRVLVARTTDFSFPSDHATVAGAVAGGLWFAGRRLGRAVIGLAIVMAFARVYVGAHYPGDVLAGLVLGAAVAVAVNRLTVRRVTALADRLVRSPLGPFVARSGDEFERA